MVIFLETMDFSSMTLTQIKRQEMDAQVTQQMVALRVLINSRGDCNFIRETSNKVPFIGRGVKIDSPLWPTKSESLILGARGSSRRRLLRASEGSFFILSRAEVHRNS